MTERVERWEPTAVGEVFAGRYELVDLIGEGGMGAVWRVWDHRHGGYLAAKVLRQSNASALLRFVREQALRIPHPHVVAPRSWAAEDERVLFTMDLVAGGSVSTLVGDHGALPPTYVACLLDQILDGLEAIHRAGVIHRDLKPANLLLEATGNGRPHVRVSDFGISVRAGEPRLTETSHLVGTPGYLAPEQWGGADPSPLQDLYGLGVIAVELLVGYRPERTSPGAPPMPEVPPAGADPRLWGLLAAMTAQDPTVRPPSATAARAALASLGVLPRTDPSGRRGVDGGPLPWQVGADPPEVFDHMPPLPAGWGPAGPRPSSGPQDTVTTVPVPRRGGAATQVPPTRWDRSRSAYAGPDRPSTEAASRSEAPSPPDAAPAKGRRRGRRVGLLVASGVLLLGAIGIGGLVVAPSVLDLVGGSQPPADGSQQRDRPASGRTAVEVGSECSFTDVAVVERDVRGRVLGCRPGENGYLWRRR